MHQRKPLEIKLVGEDDFGRRVYRSKTGCHYKDVDCFNKGLPVALYPSNGFYGEPEYPVDINWFKIVTFL